MTQRREFIMQMGAVASAMALDAEELRAGTTVSPAQWDTSWIGRVSAARYRTVFNASTMSGGAVLDFVATFLDDFHQVHGTADRDTRAVVVFRRLGTAMAFNDAMWDRYAIGEDAKVDDPDTQAPARRNVYWRATGVGAAERPRIEPLARRGMISLVCNIALGHIAEDFAERTGRTADDVRAELAGNLIPGAILVPSGIYGLIRAQNAGCAYMPGS
jgi:hypothetical protein